MGGKIPRNIKVKVIRHWLDGLTRERIAKKKDIGAGTVTAIIQEARLPLLAFAIKLQRIMEENDINEDQIEPIIQDFATYSLRYKIPYDTIIKIGREALYLEQKYDVPIEKIPQYISQGKETIDRLEDQRQEILRQKREDLDAKQQELDAKQQELDAKQQELDTIAHKFEKYRKEIPSIQRIIELESELAEAKKMNELHILRERELTKERDSAGLEAMRLKADVIELDAKRKELTRQLSLCIKELEKLGEKSTDNKSIVS